MVGRHSNASAVPARDDTQEPIRQQLTDVLLDLSFRGFEECVRLVLTKAGYTNVQIVRSAHRGRKAVGGFDGIAGADAGLAKTNVLIQLKQSKRPIQRRFVDELRGTMLRTRVQHGLLVTTSTFPYGARMAAQSEKLAPILLVDGTTLLDMLFTHNVGVCPDKAHGWRVDQTFFHRVRKLYPSKKQEHQEAAQAERGISASNLGTTTKCSQSQSCTCNRVMDCRAIDQTKGDEMRGTTHLFAGISSLWLWVLLSQGTVQDSLPFLVVCASLGSLLPDLDAQNSTIKQLKIIGVRPFALPSAVLHKSLGHRGLLHSAAGLCLIVGIVSPLSVFIGWQAIVAVALGYASHLATDAMTPSGIPLFFPKLRRVHMLPKRLRITTGSLAEDLIFPLFTTSVFLLFLYIGAGLIHRPLLA